MQESIVATGSSGVFPVEDCFVGYEQARYVRGVLTNREGFGIWDLETRGGPVETFPDDDAGREAARLRAQELIRADPGTAELLAWIRREQATRPW